MKNILKQAVSRKVVLGIALAATTVAGSLAATTSASAEPWRGGYDRGYHGDGAGVAVAAGILGLAAGAAIASSQEPYAPPVAYAPYAPAPYAPAPYVAAPACYQAYPGYYGYCYPASYYYHQGWAWRGGYWWYGGARYARPYVMGGWRGGYGWRGHGGWHR